mgnify:CR=1 FL=1
MGKLGYIFVLFGVLLMIVYGVYMVIIDFSVPLPIKVALFAIIIGIVIIIVNLIFERRKEIDEEDDSSKY